MTNITEYGDIMINTYMDEWGKRQINSLLEDGTKIIVAVGIILKQWSQTGIVNHVFSRPFRGFQLTQTLKTLGQWTLPVPSFLKQWFATLQTAHVFRRPYRRINYAERLQIMHVFGRPVRVIRFPATLQLTHIFKRLHRLVRLMEQLNLTHAYFAAFPSEKKTKLFLVIGDLSIQLSGD